jgi:S1-C subfamily serine protease
MRNLRQVAGSRRAATAAVALVIGLGAGAIGTELVHGDSSGTPVTPVQATPAALQSGSTVSQIAEASLPGVVDIVVDGVSSNSDLQPFGQQGTSQAEGSGFVLDADGHIVTNAHVVEGASTITVRFSNGDQADATLVGTDPSSDIAVLKVDPGATELHPLELGSSKDLVIGQGVVAIGSPFGLQGSVTTGIVSALDRSIQAPNGYTIGGAIQTDAAINHGNSGGPLLDSSGKVVGVNAQIASDSGGSDGVGFAIPADTVSSVAQQLIAGQSVEHAYLGVQVTTLDSATAQQFDAPAGAAITSVGDGTPAASAGLQAAGESANGGVGTLGDVVTAVDGQAVTTADDLTAAISAHKPGDKVTLTVWSNGSSRDVQVTLGTRPATAS